MAKVFFSSLLSFVVLDFVWLGFVVKRFNLEQLAEIGRIENGDMRILYAPAFLVYVMMAGLLSAFVFPKISPSDVGLLETFAWGALMGFFVYGVFDMTNLAILKNYPMLFSVTDMAWGTFVFGAVSLIVKKVA